MHSLPVIVRGDELAKHRRVLLQKKIACVRRKPGLAVILIGHDPASQMYIRFKTQASQEVGMYLETVELPENTTSKKLEKIISKFNRSRKIHGILVQLPLPEQFDPLYIMNLVRPEKDVDGFHVENVGWNTMNAPRMLPATTRGIWSLVQEMNIDVKGKHVVIVGASNIVGKPTALLFLNHGATVTICHKLTIDIAQYTKTADILITATGVANLISDSMVKEGVVVIDAGITRFKGKVVGDVDFATVQTKASYITPVPGGVGPMTVVSLLENTWNAFCRIRGLRDQEILLDDR